MTMRKAFEAWWRGAHRGIASLRPDEWLERDSIWGKGGYAQPSVHFEWEAFKAGWRSGRRAETVELLREAYDGRGNPMSVGLAYRVGQILNHLAQEEQP